MINYIATLGRGAFSQLAGIGRAAFLLLGALIHKPEPKKMFPLCLKQIYFVGVKSVSVVCVSGLFIGMVLGLQGYTILVDFAAADSLGPMVALSLLRELGPVVAALLFAGRAGSAMTAEIGLMKATEQLSSLEMMAVDPLRQVIAPRFWASLVSLPLLTLMFVAVGIIGGQIVGVDWKGIEYGTFWSILQDAVQWNKDVLNCLIKSFCFAILVTWIALFKGYDLEPTPLGISRATTATVVHSCLGVLGLDFILTAIMFGS